MTRYLILFVGRSGSTYLSELLSSHDAVASCFEKFASIREKHDGRKSPRIEVARAQIDWAIEYFKAPPDDGITAWGFKTKLKDILIPEAFRKVLQQADVSIILLERRNVVKLVTSVIRAMKLNENTGDWNLYSEVQRVPALKINPNQFQDWLDVSVARQQNVRAYAESLSQPLLQIFYENLLIEPESVMNEVGDFLGVDHFSTITNIKKATSDDLRDVIVNFEELKALYLGTEYESMFDEVLL